MNGIGAGSTKGFGAWVPRQGDIVRLKSGFDTSLEGVAVRRAGLPLKEKALYEIFGYERGEVGFVLTLCEVRVVHVGGVRHVTKVGSEPFPYALEKFERVHNQ
jgi:hypothetical protein